VRPRNLVLALAGILVAVAVVLLLAPRTVQASDFRDNDTRYTPHTVSCGPPIAYVFGATGYDDSATSAYVDGQYLPLPEACDRRLRSNLGAATLWGSVGLVLAVAALVGARWFERWDTRRDAAWRDVSARS
jgi:hypothetical protein